MGTLALAAVAAPVDGLEVLDFVSETDAEAGVLPTVVGFDVAVERPFPVVPIAAAPATDVALPEALLTVEPVGAIGRFPVTALPPRSLLPEPLLLPPPPRGP